MGYDLRVSAPSPRMLAAHDAALESMEQSSKVDLDAALVALSGYHRQIEDTGYGFRANEVSWRAMLEVLQAAGMTTADDSATVMPLQALRYNHGDRVTSNQCRAALRALAAAGGHDCSYDEAVALLVDPDVTTRLYADLVDRAVGRGTEDTVTGRLSAVLGLQPPSAPGKDDLVEMLAALVAFLMSAVDHGGFEVW